MPTAAYELVLRRLVSAPRGLVFAAWTDPAHIDRWWGPRGFSTTTAEMDVRPGGLWRYVMRHPEHGEFQNRIEYLEVVAPERLVYRHGSDAEPDQFRAEITFADEAGQTRVTLRAIFPTAAALRAAEEIGATESGDSNLDRFEEFLLGRELAAASDELVIVRVLRAPRALVWQAWTDPTHLAKWWGPKGFTMIALKLELAPGGRFHYRMRAPEGHAMGGEMWGRFVYREIVAPERLAFLSAFSDEAGRAVRAPFSPTWPLEILNTYRFSEHDGRTTIVMRGTAFEASPEERETFRKGVPSMRAGFAGTLEQLVEHLRQARPEFRTSRVFDAPRDRVFAAWSQAEHVARWFTPAPLTTASCEVDLRPGGVFRIVMGMPDGQEHPMDARFTEVVPDERIVFTARLRGDLEVHTTVTFTEHAGKTTLAVHQVYSHESPATRGAPAGWSATLDQLAAHVRAQR